MTDALALWFLTHLSDSLSSLNLLLSLRRRRAFQRLVERERAAGRLKRDDTTLLILERIDVVPADR